MKRWVVEERADTAAARNLYPAYGKWVGDVAKVSELAANFRGNGRHLVTQT